MGGKFPIRYTDATTSGQAPSVRANLDVSTGQEAIGRAVSGFGGAIFDEGLKVQGQQDAMALSELNRQDDELAAITASELDKVTDEETQNKLIEEYELKSKALAEKNNSRVQFAFTKNLNNTIGSRKAAFVEKGLVSRKKDADSKYRFELQQAYESGDMGKVYKIVSLAEGTGIIGQAEHDAVIKDAEGNSKLAMAERKLLSGDSNASLSDLNAMDVSKLSVQQLEQRAKLIDTASRQSKQNSDAAEVQVLFDLNANRGKSDVEKMVLGKQYIDQLKTSGISPERAGAMIDRIEKWQTSEVVKTNPQLKAELRNWANDISLGVRTKEEVTKRLNDENIAGKLADSDYGELTTLMDEELQRGRAEGYSESYKQAVNTIVSLPDDNAFADSLDAITKNQPVDVAKILRKTKNEERQIQFKYINVYMDDLKEWLKANPNKSKSDFEAYSAERLVVSHGKSIIEMRGAIESHANKAQGKKEEYKVGDTKVRQGKTWTYQGNNIWSD